MTTGTNVLSGIATDPGHDTCTTPGCLAPASPSGDRRRRGAGP